MNRKERNKSLFDTEVRSDDLKKKSVQGGAYSMLFQVIESVLRVGSIAVLARLLIPEYFGLISMVTAIIAFAEQFKDFGLSVATVQQKTITHDQVSNLFWVNAMLGFIIMVIISSVSFLIAKFYADERLIYITIAISTGFLWGGLTIQHDALLRRQMKFAAIGAIQLVSTIISTVIAIILAVKGYGYWSLVWREVLRSFFISSATCFFCPWLPGLPKKHVKIGHMLKFGRDVAGFNIIVFLTVNLDQILIGRFHGPVQLGLYRQAFNLIFSPTAQILQPVARVAIPSLSFLKDDAERYKTYFGKSLMILNFFLMPLILYLFVNSYEVVLVVLGEKWLEATDFFRILAIAAFIRPASDLTLPVLVTCGKTKRFFNLGLVTSLILLASFVIGVQWGALGVAYGYLAATYILLVIRLCFGFKGTPINAGIFFRSIMRPLMSSIVMMIVLIVFRRLVYIDNILLSLTISFVVAVITYLLSWIMMAGGKESLKIIINDIIEPLNLKKYFLPQRS